MGALGWAPQVGWARLGFAWVGLVWLWLAWVSMGWLGLAWASFAGLGWRTGLGNGAENGNPSSPQYRRRGNGVKGGRAGRETGRALIEFVHECKTTPTDVPTGRARARTLPRGGRVRAPQLPPRTTRLANHTNELMQIHANSRTPPQIIKIERNSSKIMLVNTR
jgi:hypothetical protein